MRVSIIPEDGVIYIDGRVVDGLDLSGIRKEIHAVQWYETVGEVEIKDIATNKNIKNVEITDLSEFQQYIDLALHKKADAEALKGATP